MGGGASQTSNSTTSQSSSTQPWTDAQPLLKNLLSDYSSANPSVTPEQSAAIANLQGVGGAIPQFGASTLYAPITKGLDFNTSPEQAQLASVPGMLSSGLSQTLDQNNLDPFKTPGFSDAINTAVDDATKAVKSTYAGSGRDPSGAGSFAQSLGRGIMQGVSPTIAAQFNTNRGAQNSATEALAGTTGSTAVQGAGLKTGDLTAQLGSLGYLPQALQDFVMPAQTQMQFANTAFNQPFANLKDLLGPSLGLGAMGSESQGTGTQSGTVTQSNSGIGNIMGGISGGLGILGALI